MIMNESVAKAAMSLSVFETSPILFQQLKSKDLLRICD